MLKNSKIRTILFAAVNAAALSACGGGGGASNLPSTDLIDNAVTVRGVQDQIRNLPSAEELTVHDKAAVEKALAAYANLSNSNKSLVAKTEVDKLNTLLNQYNSNTELAKGISAQIATLPSEIAKNDETALTAARKNYNNLTDAQKTWLSEASLKALAAAETKADTNKQLADKLKTNIAALPSEISKEDAAKVTAARKQFTDLTDAQETWVEKGSVAALEKAESMITSNMAKAEQLAEKIAALPENGLDIDTDDEIAAFTATKKAFDDLSDSEETWVAQTAVDKLNTISAKAVIDAADTSLAKINEPAPLPSAFLTLAVNGQAQQFNPHMQLRQNDSLLSNQPRLIRELAVNQFPSKQNGIGLNAIGVYDFKNPGNPPGKIERISKISANAIQTNGSGKPVDVSADVVHKQNTDKEYLASKWSSIYAIRTDTGVTIILRDPAEMGWNYQTFAYYNDIENNITHAYQSVGTETAASAMPTSGTATYKGATAGHYVSGSSARQLTADVNAVVDFSKKLVRFATHNTQLHSAANGIRVTPDKADDLNMTGNGSWKSGNQFIGTVKASNGMSGDLNGKFYGANAAEIGGTYGLKNAANTEQLIGGYGAKRQ